MSAAPIVFFDIAGPADAKLGAFYKTVFGWEFGPTGNVTVQIAGPSPSALSGTLRADPADKLLYIGVPDINATLDQIKANGGSVDAPRFAVPGVVILALWRDPAGNRMGLVEMENGKAKAP